ncbi:hypothetical protein EDC01DRAFT_19287 [Geopyxis carbonaria]|nr:hypothetical protein EDC01DRAFT_19287 [Geopyxis carbonaria]
MRLTLGYLQRLENDHNNKNPDLVTSFITEQQALHKKRCASDGRWTGSGTEYPLLCTSNNQENTLASCKKSRRYGSSESSFIELANGFHLEEIDRDSNHISWKSPKKVDGRRIKNFEKRSRHKPRTTNRSTKIHQKGPKNSQSKSKSKSDKRTTKNRSDVLIEGFTSNHIMNPRVTLHPEHKLGIFKNGFAVSLDTRIGLPDLSYSKMNFLMNKPPRPSLADFAYDDSESRKKKEGSQDSYRIKDWMCGDQGRASNDISSPGSALLSTSDRSECSRLSSHTRFGTCGPGTSHKKSVGNGSSNGPLPRTLEVSTETDCSRNNEMLPSNVMRLSENYQTMNHLEDSQEKMIPLSPVSRLFRLCEEYEPKWSQHKSEVTQNEIIQEDYDGYMQYPNDLRNCSVWREETQNGRLSIAIISRNSEKPKNLYHYVSEDQYYCEQCVT